MFLRFSKGKFNKNDSIQYRKCVFLGDAVIMEYGNKIVGIAKLHEESDKLLDYDVIVATQCELGAQSISRFIKDMIGKSNKFETTPTTKRRKYYVQEIECDELPIIPQIIFKRK